MINLSKYLLTLTFGVAVFGAVACSNSSDSLVSSNESDGLASLDDGKKDFFTWVDLQVFDAKADLPSCEKFEGVAQVIDEKAFFACFEDEWIPIGASVPTYDQLPKCKASMNDFCIDIMEGEKIEESYICDEGEWVKGKRIGSSGVCLKGNENILSFDVFKELLSNELPEGKSLEDYVMEIYGMTIEEYYQTKTIEQIANQINNQITNQIINQVKKEMCNELSYAGYKRTGPEVSVKDAFKVFIDAGCCSLSSYKEFPLYSVVCE